LKMGMLMLETCRG